MRGRGVCVQQWMGKVERAMCNRLCQDYYTLRALPQVIKVGARLPFYDLFTTSSKSTGKDEQLLKVAQELRRKRS